MLRCWHEHRVVRCQLRRYRHLLGHVKSGHVAPSVAGVVVVYKASPLEYAIGKRLLRVPHISLVNLIAEREVVQELLQEKATAENISAEVKKLMADGAYRTEMLRSGYGEVRRRIDTGSATENTARLMIADLRAVGGFVP